MRILLHPATWLLLALALAPGCQRTSLLVMPDAATRTPAPDLSRDELFMRGIAHDPDYRFDFPISAEPVPVQPDTLRLVRLATTTREPQVLAEHYPQIKALLAQLSQADHNRHFASPVQKIALHYLRKLYLPNPKRPATAEVVYLLNLLVDYRATDLDVLADAYHRAQSKLAPSQRQRPLNYIQALYDQELAVCNEKLPPLRQAYQAVTAKHEKLALYTQIQDLENRWLACQHAARLLKL